MKLKDLLKVMEVKPYTFLEDKNHKDISNSKSNLDFDDVLERFKNEEIQWLQIGDSFMTITLNIVY